MNLKIIFFTGVALTIVGCASNQPQSTVTYIPGGAKNPEQLSPDIYPKGAFSEPEPVIREGRYRIVSTRHPLNSAIFWLKLFSFRPLTHIPT